MDLAIRSGSRIARLPKIMQPLAVCYREAREAVRPTTYSVAADGIKTVHNAGFMDEQAFIRAHDRAVKAAGWDYNIPYRIHQILWCTRSAPPGVFVEAGTGRGFLMSAVMQDQPDRTAHLFDTFASQFPDADGNQTGEVSANYANSFQEVLDNFAEWPGVTLHPGNVFDTLEAADLRDIAFLHIDMNCAAPEVHVLQKLWPRMKPGAFLLLDDYAYTGYESQYDAMREVAKELGIEIMSTPTGQGIALKAAPK
jgi:hypothetical protein